MCSATRPCCLGQGATRKVAFLAILTPSAQPRGMYRSEDNGTLSRMTADPRTEFGTGVVISSLSLVRLSGCRGLHPRQLRVVLCLRQVWVFTLLSILFIGADSVLKEFITVVWNGTLSRRARPRL